MDQGLLFKERGPPLLMKISLVGLYGYDNLGDQILCDTCEYLVTSAIKNGGGGSVDIQHIDLMPSRNNLSSIRRFVGFFIHAIRFVFIHFLRNKQPSMIIDTLLFWETFILFSGLYRKALSQSQAVIFVGGAYLKFKGEFFQYNIRVVLNLCERKSIPVMLNGIGVEGFDSSDIRCKRLKTAINQKSVKIITTRDDLELLRSKFIQSKNIITDLVGDSALWLKECYSVQPNKNRDNLIGLNISFLHLFQVYGLPYGVDDYVAIYKEIIAELTRKEIDFRLYTNGKKDDHGGGKLLLEKLGLDSAFLLPNAVKPKDFINQINTFSCVVPLRLHSCIVAYALGIPSVGFIWNEKVMRFAKILRMADNFQRIESLSSESLVNSIDNVDKFSFDTERHKELKYLTKKYIENFISNYVLDIKL